MAQDIAEWLAGLGLEQYAQTFRDNAIDIALLPALTDAHLKELALPMGHRLKLLQAIATLREGAVPPPAADHVLEQDKRTKEAGSNRAIASNRPARDPPTAYRVAIPAQAGTHVGDRHRPSPVWAEAPAPVAVEYGIGSR